MLSFVVEVCPVVESRVNCIELLGGRIKRDDPLSRIPKVAGKLSRLFDGKVIDGFAVNGSAGLVGLLAGMARKLQSGYLYHYAFAMILGLVALLALANHYWL